GDEVAAIAADDEQTAVEALRLIEVDYELLPHVVDLEEAIGDMAPRLDTDGNVAEAATHKRGDAKRGLKEADFVVDATYRTTLQQMRIGGKGGRITALEHISWANVGQGKWVANPTGPTNTLYDIANLSSKSYKVVTNAGSLSAFRAPGYVEGTFALESAIDEL